MAHHSHNPYCLVCHFGVPVHSPYSLKSQGRSHILVSILGDKAWVNRTKEMYYSLFISFVVLPKPQDPGIYTQVYSVY